MTADRELDVRTIQKGARHPRIFAVYDELQPGQALVLTNDHEPLHLHDEFERELPGSYTWESLGEQADGSWQVRIERTTRTQLPRIVADATAILAELEPGSGGSVWQLSPAARDLDANIIALAPGDAIATHDGPDLDVVIHVLAGSGTLTTEATELPLTPGAIVWLPAKAQRRIDAGEDGLRYFSVHHRKPTLGITLAPARS